MADTKKVIGVAALITVGVGTATSYRDDLLHPLRHGGIPDR
jgi:hypothetical protein